MEEAGVLVRFVSPTCLREQTATHVNFRWLKKTQIIISQRSLPENFTAWGSET
jgi:hypothetical protein